MTTILVLSLALNAVFITACIYRKWIVAKVTEAKDKAEKIEEILRK